MLEELIAIGRSTGHVNSSSSGWNKIITESWICVDERRPLEIVEITWNTKEYLFNINGGKKEGIAEKGQMHQMEHNQQNDSQIQWDQ